MSGCGQDHAHPGKEQVDLQPQSALFSASPTTPDSIMIEDEYPLLPVGFVRSTLRSRAGVPRQGSEDAPDAWLFLDDGVAAGVEGIAVDDELIVLTWLHEARRDFLRVRPRDDPKLPITGCSGHDLPVGPTRSACTEFACAISATVRSR